MSSHASSYPSIAFIPDLCVGYMNLHSTLLGHLLFISLSSQLTASSHVYLGLIFFPYYYDPINYGASCSINYDHINLPNMPKPL